MSNMTTIRADLSTLGKIINDALHKRDWSIRTLAMYAELAPSTLSSLIKAKHVPAPETLRAVAQVLELDEAYLLRLAGHLEDIPGGLKDPRVLALAQRIDALPPHIRDEALMVLEAQVESMYQISGMFTPAEFKELPPAPPNKGLDPAAIIEGLVRLAQENPTALLQLMTQLQSGQLGKESGGE